jgi:hypothetical protein
MSQPRSSFLLGMLPFFFAVGCAKESPVSDDVKNAIALCSSGVEISQSARANLSAEISKILSGPQSASVEVEVKNAIRGIAFTGETLSTPEGVQAFEAYTACVQQSLGV